MKDNGKKEELESRRQFFKKAAKAALPFLAVSALNVPIISHAINHEAECYCYGCVGGCQGDCLYSCLSGCYSTCKGSCTGNCLNTCVGTCQGSCSSSCYTTCYYSSSY